MGNIVPIMLNTLLDLAKTQAPLFNALPEFNFVLPLAEKIKAKGCACGLGGEIADATVAFNAVVQNLTEEQQLRLRHLLGRPQLAFGIQTKTSFEVKTY